MLLSWITDGLVLLVDEDVVACPLAGVPSLDAGRIQQILPQREPPTNFNCEIAYLEHGRFRAIYPTVVNQEYPVAVDRQDSEDRSTAICLGQ